MTNNPQIWQTSPRLIKAIGRAVLYQYAGLHLQVLGRPRRFIFILSHMRSGSSLLTHLLNAHPQINGFGESHIYYMAQENLKTLLLRNLWHLKKPILPQDYVLDKILHDEIAPSFALPDNLRIIFLLRQPEPSIKSIIRLFQDRPKMRMTEQQARDYYLNRLTSLENYSQQVSDSTRKLTITYEQLLDQTQPVLNLLQTFLETEQPFSESYKTLSTTGVKGVGDSSKYIQAGRIVRQRESSNMRLDPEMIASCQAAFTQTYQTLAKDSLSLMQSPAN